MKVLTIECRRIKDEKGFTKCWQLYHEKELLLTGVFLGRLKDQLKIQNQGVRFNFVNSKGEPLND